MLIDVLTRLSADTGFHAVRQRAALIALLNQSAKEMHHELECNKVYRECTLVATPDALISLPSFIGELRGLRMHTNEIPIDYAAISKPRYVNNTLQHKFKNWRDLGERAVHTFPSLVGQLTIETQQAEETPVTVLISGQTNLAHEDQEEIEVASPSQTTTKLFGPTIYAISCVSDNRTADITIKDANGIEIAILYNVDRKTRYKIIDVSQVFWSLDTSAGETLVDVLYKLPFRQLTRDSDSFFAGEDFDEAWYQMSMYFFLNTKENRKQEALILRGAAMDFIKSAKDSGEQSIDKKIGWVRNPLYGLFRRWRYYPGSVTNVDNNTQH